jgi:hypothetical protein
MRMVQWLFGRFALKRYERALWASVIVVGLMAASACATQNAPNIARQGGSAFDQRPISPHAVVTHHAGPQRLMPSACPSFNVGGDPVPPPCAPPSPTPTSSPRPYIPMPGSPSPSPTPSPSPSPAPPPHPSPDPSASPSPSSLPRGSLPRPLPSSLPAPSSIPLSASLSLAGDTAICYSRLSRACSRLTGLGRLFQFRLPKPVLVVTQLRSVCVDRAS